MKGLVTITMFAAVVFISSCGPSAQEIEAQRINDSAITADSLAKIQTHQQRIADSIAFQDSINNAGSKGR
jgi:hypothetical protein